MFTDRGQVLFVKMRLGVKSLSPETDDQSFMQLGPMLLSGVCERLAPWAGQLETVVGTYVKVVLIVAKLEGRYLALTIDRADAPVIRDLIQLIKTLGA